MSAPAQAVLSPRARAALYAAEAAAHLLRLVSMLDREAGSATAGLMDRSYWAWKFRDAPITMMQSPLAALAMAWREPVPGCTLCGNEQLGRWLALGVEATLGLQAESGAFPVWGPGTDNPGVTLAMALACARVLEQMSGHLGEALETRLGAAIRRACEFALLRGENYGFISNHQALFALAFLKGSRLTGETRYRARAEETVGEILRRQSADGWYEEYGGPDPGYESLGISYLAEYWKETRDAALLDSLRRSAEFLAHCVHPDGSVGGVYGSRHTQQYYPAGIEALAGEIPLAEGIARFMAGRLERRNVLVPATADGENLGVLLGNYLQAWSEAQSAGSPAPASLPCEALRGVKHCAASGITFASTGRYYAVSHAGRGNMLRVFDRRSEKIAYEDAGYVARAGGATWTSQRPGASPERFRAAGREVRATAEFSEVGFERLGPLQFALFRLAGLTVLRNAALAAWMQKKAVARLIVKQKAAPLRLVRKVLFDEEEIAVSDTLESLRGPRPESVELARAFTAIHMGAAKYFQGSELEATPVPDTPLLARELQEHGVASLEFRLRFREGVPAEMVCGGVGQAARVKTEEGALLRQ